MKLIGKMILELSELAIKGTPEIYSYMLEKAPIIIVNREVQDYIVEEVEVVSPLDVQMFSASFEYKTPESSQAWQ